MVCQYVGPKLGFDIPCGANNWDATRGTFRWNIKTFLGQGVTIHNRYTVEYHVCDMCWGCHVVSIDMGCQCSTCAVRMSCGTLGGKALRETWGRMH